MTVHYPRDMVGYGATPLEARWPGDARIALQFVINYEEGGENAIFHGDPAAEAFLSEWIGAQPVLGMRNMNMESLFEYGSRAGFWRLHRAFTSRKVPVTVYGIAMATNPNPIVLSEGAHKYREQVDELVAAFETFPGLSEAFQAYAGKFGGTFARLLLTMHVIENCPGWVLNEGLEERERLKVVSEETARRTFDIMTKFLIPNAVRQYERLDKKGKRQEVEDGRRFAGYILSHGLTQVTNRVLHDASKDFRDKDRAGKMMVLTAAAWISGTEVNSRVHEIYVERAAAERKTRAERMAKLERGHETIRQIYG